MCNIKDWHRLMACVGIHGPLIQTSQDFKQQDTHFFNVPLEIRIAIYEVLLQEESWDPIMLRTTSSHLCVHVRRPAAFSRLLLLSKQVYSEAVLLPFSYKPFRLHLHNEMQEIDPTRRIPHDKWIGNTVLCMPRHLDMALKLEATGGLTVQLTRLRAVLDARKDASFVTSVSLSLARLTSTKKRAVVLSLSTFFRNQNVLMELHGAGDLLEHEEDDELATAMERLSLYVNRSILRVLRADLYIAQTTLPRFRY